MAGLDVVVIGAGHNGLVAAGYLAKAGARVLVLERRSVVGGACVTEEPWPGYRINTFAYASGLLRPKIIEDLELTKFGYEPIVCDPQGFSPQPDGRHVTFWLDEEREREEIAKFSAADARAYPKYVEFWDRALDLIEPAMMAPPMPLDQFIASFPTGQAEVMLRELFLRSARDFLDDWFESPELKGSLAAGATIGAFAGPYTPGTAYILGHHNIGRLGEHRRVWGQMRGGMGQITEALARSATRYGATIRTGTGVKGIIVEGGRAVGVVTESGESIRARAVASSVDTHRTFLEFLPAGTLEAPMERRLQRVRSRGACLKFNAALRGLPQFTAAPDSSYLVGAVGICPSMEYLERAFDDAKYGRFSSEPSMDVYFQTLVDPTMAPPGQHTMTCFVQYAPSELRQGSWDDARDQVAETILSTLEIYAPGIRGLIRHWQLQTPLDIERTLGMRGGNIDQGDITPDQIFSFRPIPGWSNYRTPVPGLYLCGSAAHPGGGVIGAPGHNAARVLLDDLHAGLGKGPGSSARATDGAVG
ncbi:MAG TPA: NAD(P)/FAD-dependent oxidoreductase [Thermoplasmata archaeon]|nr:NAD(P)/FAD-dependent oxidoreductase [Thermoplasmata archaeon]